MKRKGRLEKNFYKCFVWILFLLLTGMVTKNNAHAASAIVTLNTGEDEVVKGDTFSLLVSIDSADEIGNVEMFIVFDKSKVSFVSGGKYAIGQDGLVLISDWNRSSSSSRKKYSLEFKAKKEGDCKFSVGDQPAICLAGEEDLMSVSSVNLDIKVVAKESQAEETKKTEKENQENSSAEEFTSDTISASAQDRIAQLKNIMLADGTLTPEFDKDITSYRVTLPNEITKLALSALPEKDEDEVEIKGNDNLQVGENTVTITVKASDGADKKYTIVVVREADMSVLEQTDTLSNGSEEGVHCIETKDGIVMTQYAKILVKRLENETEIPQGYMETSIRIDENSITAYMPQDDMESETYLIYGTDGKENTEFYEYNRVDKTLKLYKPSYGGSTTAGNTKAVSANFQMMTVIVILGVICAGLSVALVLQILKAKQRRELEEEEFFRNLKE